jgi:hypothetical protein
VFRRCYSRKTGAASLTTALIAVSAIGLYSARPARANETVRACSPFGNSVFQHAAVFGINTGQVCPSPAVGGGGMQIWSAGNTVAAGQRASWQANAPAGLIIVGASVPNQSLLSTGVNDGEGYGGGFYWAGGGAQTHDGESGAGFGPLWSSYFGFQLVCGANPCRSGTSQLDVGEADLYVQETVGPGLVSPDGLWQSSGWIRGDWNLHFWGDSPSGLCSVNATSNGQSVASVGSGQNPSVWHQCNAPAISQTIHTWQDGNGAMPLTLGAWDAAGVPVSYTKTIYIDNSQPTISLSGPAEAPSTAGTQYVTATGSAGPSGVSGIGCSADGAPYQWYPKATVQVPVAGVGVHRVTCYSANNARDASGNVATSAPQSWTLSVREPTVSGIGFGKLVDALLCRRVTKRVKVPAHWVTVRRHHSHVRVRRRARTKLERVTRCHPRIVRRRITVWKTVIRHGKKVRVKRHKTIRVVQLPHVVMHSSKRVGHGKRTIVSGWVGMPDGTALGGQAVQVLTAPDNGLGHFVPAAVVTTAANGSWSAQLPAGPSRLVEAYYAGAPTLEPSVSAQVHVIVPARVKLLSVSPRRVAWGGTVHITGQLVGGYLPPGGALVRLRIGQGSSYQTYGVQEHVTGSGRFTTTYQFGAGDPAVYRSFWFQIATLPMGNYPYAPAASGRRSVLVGGHPRPPVTHRRHRHNRRRHRKQ